MSTRVGKEVHGSCRSCLVHLLLTMEDMKTCVVAYAEGGARLLAILAVLELLELTKEVMGAIVVVLAKLKGSAKSTRDDA